ncbi:MAG: FkbM family methyltransferase, partial [Rhodospirillales bacterium]
MTKLYARFLVALVTAATAILGRWRRLTVRARAHHLLAPESTVMVNGVAITLLVPDRASVYWPRHGFASEPGTLAWIEGFTAADVLYDVGANVGAFTLYAAKARAVRVVAFEPNPFTYRVLVRNLHLNDVAELVTPLCLAANDATGARPLFLKGTEAGSVGHHLDEGDSDDEGLRVQALAYALDDVAAIAGIPRPTHVKIDVDGIEAAVLEGGRRLLSDRGLKSVMIELLTHDEAGQARIQGFLGDCGLRP